MDVIVGLLSHLDWISIATALLGFVLGLGIIKKKLETAKHVILDVSKLVSDFSKDLEDNKLTKEELQDLIEDIKQVVDAFKAKS